MMKDGTSHTFHQWRWPATMPDVDSVPELRKTATKDNPIATS